MVALKPVWNMNLDVEISKELNSDFKDSSQSWLCRDMEVDVQMLNQRYWYDFLDDLKTPVPE